MSRIVCFTAVLFATIGVSPAAWACKVPAPSPAPVVKAFSGFKCANGWNSSGNTCVPGSSSTYAIAKTSSSFQCGNGYQSSGDMCPAYASSCKGYAHGGGSCTGAYRKTGDMCVSD